MNENLLEILKEYYRDIKKEYSTGEYTEFSFRTPFENFIKSLNKNFTVHQEQKRMRGLGAPDFKAFRKAVNVGYIETKNLGVNLDEILKTEQLERYKEGIDNLILTNYSRFILIRRDEKIFDISLFDISDLDRKDCKLSDDTLSRFNKLIENFFSYKTASIRSAPQLARELSKKARLLKEIAKDQLEEDLKRIERGESPSPVYGFYGGIKELIRDINIDDCADAYAQTITYGIFLAKTNFPEQLERGNLVQHIPESIGLIRKIFINVILDKQSHLNIVWIIEDIIDILNASDIKKILSEIDSRGKKDKDPFLFFYEDFLDSYDPEKRKHFGEYYTPRPVVNFILNITNQILKDDFGKQKGFAEDDVTVLDPGVGTGTFLWIAYLLTFKELKENGLGGLINQKIRGHLLKNFYGFEISIISYIIAHLKLTTLLERWSYKIKGDERIQVYLTNTLERTETHGLLPFMEELSEESIKAGWIKDKPILVITGNPPYHGLSANKGEWINRLLKEGYKRADESKDEGYYKVDGKPLGEKNPKWLQDDYVKFIRFGQWKLDKTGEGILAFINNHSFIDNPTFRGMRESLLQSFNRIYILNLHGNTRKKEKCPDGSKDENVFNIQQGVSINIFVKNNKYKDKKVFYADLWGDRTTKFQWLDRFALDSKNWLKTINWQEVKPKSPNYYFIPRDYSLEEEYMKYWKITDVFQLHGVGMTTARDRFVMNFKKGKILSQIREFKNCDLPDGELHKKFNIKQKKGWSIRKAWNMLQEIPENDLEKYIFPVQYTPFDIRFIFYHDSVVWRTVKRVMQHMLVGDNIGLITTRQTKDNWGAFVTDNIIRHKALAIYDISSLFPFYLYSNDGETRKSNINSDFLFHLVGKNSNETNPEEIFFYIYAVMNSKKYQERYHEFLKLDFPRIPLVNNYTLVKKLSNYGKELADLHLMKIHLPTETKFEIQGSNKVDRIHFKDKKVYINKEQYFDGIHEYVWNFYTGGYQVLDKWLKSRKKRELSSSEIEQFLQIVEIIKKTQELMGKIDETNFLDHTKEN